jgi:hypothetical protein
MTASRLLPALALILFAASEATGQRFPVTVGGPSEGRSHEPRRRSLYERPTLSPWIGVDVGLGIPFARCAEECGGRKYGGFASSGTAAVGVTVLSRLTFAAERSWMNVFDLNSDPTTTAKLTMGTLRVGTRGGLLGKVGVGRAGFTAGPTRLVDDQLAWTVGGEKCGLSRIDLCVSMDYSEADLGSPVFYNSNTETAQYRMRTLRAGFIGRLHLLRGRRVTLPPREPVGHTGSLP